MIREDVARAAVAIVIAAVCIKTGVTRLPVGEQILRHPPVVVYSEPMLPPLIVRAARRVVEHERHLFDRAKTGNEVRVSLTQYCLQGTTRRDNYVRAGIVAADPRVFPLARYVEVFIGKRYLGKYLVDDTGSKVKGPTLDIWTPSCSEARRFGPPVGDRDARSALAATAKGVHVIVCDVSDWLHHFRHRCGDWRVLIERTTDVDCRGRDHSAWPWHRHRDWPNEDQRSAVRVTIANSCQTFLGVWHESWLLTGLDSVVILPSPDEVVVQWQ